MAVLHKGTTKFECSVCHKSFPNEHLLKVIENYDLDNLIDTVIDSFTNKFIVAEAYSPRQLQTNGFQMLVLSKKLYACENIEGNEMSLTCLVSSSIAFL